MTAANYDKLEKMEAWAQAQGRSLNELAQVWLLAQPQVCSVISGMTRLDQLMSNVKAVDWALTPEEEAEIRAILESGA